MKEEDSIDFLNLKEGLILHRPLFLNDFSIDVLINLISNIETTGYSTKVNIAHLLQIHGLSKSEVSRYIKPLIQCFLSQRFSDESFMRFSLVSKLVFHDKENSLEIETSQLIHSCFVLLRSQYSLDHIKIVLKFKGKYTSNFYHAYLYKFKTNSNWLVTFTDFVLEITENESKSHATFAIFKTKVLEPIEKDIKQVLGFNISFTKAESKEKNPGKPKVQHIKITIT